MKIKNSDIPAGYEKKHADYLNRLRKSGVTNMMGAGAYLQRTFGLDKYAAGDYLLYWMHSFKDGE